MEISISGAQARKIGRLSALLPDSDIRLRRISGDREDDDYGALSVEFLNQYGGGSMLSAVTDLRCEHIVVVRDDGWSNPSIARFKARASS